MIRDYNELRRRVYLELLFFDYQMDWKHKDKIEIGSFIPQIEIDEIDTLFLIKMCEHARKLNQFQTQKLEEIENLNNLLLKKLEGFQSEELERRETLLESESQLDTIIFILAQSRIEIKTTKKEKGQITLF